MTQRNNRKGTIVLEDLSSLGLWTGDGALRKSRPPQLFRAISSNSLSLSGRTMPVPVETGEKPYI